MKVAVLRVTAILAVVMAFAAVSVQAQSAIKKQTFDVPFQFNVGDKVMPAGEYTFTADAQTVRVRSKNGKENVIALPQRTLGASQIASEVKLTFRHYGGQYYLSQIWLQDGVGRELKRQRPANSDVAQNFKTVEVLNRAN